MLLALSGCGGGDAAVPQPSATPAAQLPGALTNRNPPTSAELAELSDVPSDVAPDPEEISRIRLENRTIAKYFVARWNGPADDPGDFFCVYRLDPAQPGAVTDCFNTQDYLGGAPTIVTARVGGAFELVGFTPDPEARINVQTPDGSKRIRVTGNAFGVSASRALESIEISAFGKTSEISLK